jgi:signal transduction histidine kinase
MLRLCQPILFCSFLLVFSTFSCKVFSQSQAKTDSLLSFLKIEKKDTAHVQALIELSVLERDDFVLSNQYGTKAMEIAQSLDDQNMLLLAYMNMIKLYYSARVNDSALYFVSIAKEMAIKLKDGNLLAEIKLDAGNVQLNLHNRIEALSEFISAAEILDSLSINPKNQMIAYANIGNVQILLGNYEKALFYISKGLIIAKEINFEDGIAYCLKSQGGIYRKLMELDLAEDSYKQALDSYEKIGNQSMLSEVHQNLGTVYFDRNDFEAAIKQYEQSLFIAKNDAITYQIPYSYAALGASWIEMKNLSKAKAYFDSTLVFARGQNPYLVMDSYENLALIEELQENYQESLSYVKLFNNLSDSLNAVENRLAAEEIESKYQSVAKQNQIELLEKDKELQQAKLKRQQANILILGILSISVFIIGAILINRYRVTNRIRRQLDIEKMRLGIAQDLHDDIGSTLSSIQIISKVAKQQELNQKEISLEKIEYQATVMMDKLGDIVWSLKATSDSMEDLVAKTKEFASELLEPLNIEIAFEGMDLLLEQNLDLEKRKNLYLIFKEALNNAAKYSQCSHIQVSFKPNGQSGTYQLVITDDGKGFDLQQVSKGNGLTHIKERAEKIKGKLEIKSEISKGTQVVLDLALHN